MPRPRFASQRERVRFEIMQLAKEVGGLWYDGRIVLPNGFAVDAAVLFVPNDDGACVGYVAWSEVLRACLSPDKAIAPDAVCTLLAEAQMYAGEYAYP